MGLFDHHTGSFGVALDDCQFQGSCSTVDFWQRKHSKKEFELRLRLFATNKSILDSIYFINLQAIVLHVKSRFGWVYWNFMYFFNVNTLFYQIILLFFAKLNKILINILQNPITNSSYIK